MAFYFLALKSVQFYLANCSSTKQGSIEKKKRFVSNTSSSCNVAHGSGTAKYKTLFVWDNERQKLSIFENFIFYNFYIKSDVFAAPRLVIFVVKVVLSLK